MKTLVTGAAGFVGSRLSRALLDRGDEVVGFDNLNDYYSLAYKELHLADLRPHPRFKFVQADLRDAEGLLRLIREEQPDAIAHLAALAAVRYSVEHPLLYADVNVQGSVNLLDAARQVGQPRVVLASTGSVYGSDTPVPFREDAAAAMPLAPYPASKRAMELFGYTYHHLWGLPTTVLRFFNAYGPHGRPDMMPWKWTEQILRGQPLTLYAGGRLQRDWTFIDDLLSGIIAALDTGLEWETINLGCSSPVENLEFVRILEELLGRQAEIVDTPAPASEPTITYADVTKAGRLLGYRPRTSVQDGLAAWIAWLRTERLMAEFGL